MHAKLLQASAGQAQCTARPARVINRSVRAVRCLAAARGSPVPAQQSREHKELPQALSPALQLGLLSMLSAAPALAEDAVEEAVAAAAPKLPGIGFTPAEVLILLTPIVLYALFNVYRDNVNPRAKLSDFFFILAGLAVLANIISIVAFKVRLF